MFGDQSSLSSVMVPRYLHSDDNRSALVSKSLQWTTSSVILLIFRRKKSASCPAALPCPGLQCEDSSSWSRLDKDEPSGQWGQHFGNMLYAMWRGLVTSHSLWALPYWTSTLLTAGHQRTEGSQRINIKHWQFLNNKGLDCVIGATEVHAEKPCRRPGHLKKKIEGMQKRIYSLINTPIP